VKTPYVAFQEDAYTFTPAAVAQTIQTMIDISGENGDIIRSLNVPPSYVILDRVTVGLAGLLGRLHARNRWRALLDEYRHGAPPATALGEQEIKWRASRTPAAR
jgi:hypothetical protein